MAKKISKVIKMQLPAGKATAAPPVGTMLGPAGINLGEFCTKYNEATKDKIGDIIPVEISVYEDRTFDFILKTPPTTFLLKEKAKVQKGSLKGANELVATITKDDLKEIAEKKIQDLNTKDLEKAMNSVMGTARNMGISVKGLNEKELLEQVKEAEVAEEEMAKLSAELETLESEAKASAENELPEVEAVEQKEPEEETKEEK